MTDDHAGTRWTAHAIMERLENVRAETSVDIIDCDDSDLMRFISKRQAIESAISLWVTIAYKDGTWTEGLDFALARKHWKAQVHLYAEADIDSDGAINGYDAALMKIGPEYCYYDLRMAY